MPGMIDAHVHVTAYTANFAELARSSPGYVAAHAARIMGDMLDRGFTSVRDVGGADFGLARAVEEGLIRGPRLFFGGKALSPTGGHGDVRGPGFEAYDSAYTQPGLGMIVDGVPQVRRAARAEVRRGAHHLKIMGGGGISSPTDRITSDQFSEEEIAAVVEEAAMANLYVVVHAYTARSITRCARLGVRSIEHGNLADDEGGRGHEVQ
jgi:imidazolonepropionase-like amidohydrolase